MSELKVTIQGVSQLLEHIAKMQRHLSPVDAWKIKEAIDELALKYDKLQEEYVVTNDALMEEVVRRQQLESEKLYWKQYPEHKPSRVGYYIIKEQSSFHATEAVQCFFWNNSEAFSWDTVKWFCEIPNTFVLGEVLCR